MEIQNPKNPKEHAKTSKKMQEYAKICTIYHSKQSTWDIDTPQSDEKHKQYASTKCTICQGTENFLQVNLQVKLGFTLQRHNIIAERLA